MVLAQDRFRTDQGKIQFDASTPLEDIHAVNDHVSAILNSENGEIAVLLLHKDFKFRRRLMQEHFNENYMESHKYPKGVFRGKINGFKADAVSDSPKEYTAAGELTLHGVTRALSTPILLHREEGGITISLNFVVKSEDYGIKVPKILFKKVAREVEVTGALTLRPVTK